ncbi:MAG TPA: septum formation initiator family protein [Verrucomicrobiae bacterium]|nr:septum formation initiator family protein [Verrucomicrobiae bacterium]
MIYLGAMHAEFNPWDKLTRVVIFLLFIAGLMGVGFWYYPLIQKNENYRKEILKLEAHIQKEEEVSRQLKSSLEALRSDPKAIERLARENLGYAKPGEIVVRFGPPGTNAVQRF